MNEDFKIMRRESREYRTSSLGYEFIYLRLDREAAIDTFLWRSRAQALVSRLPRPIYGRKIAAYSGIVFYWNCGLGHAHCAFTAYKRLLTRRPRSGSLLFHKTKPPRPLGPPGYPIIGNVYVLNMPALLRNNVLNTVQFFSTRASLLCRLTDWHSSGQEECNISDKTNTPWRPTLWDGRIVWPSCPTESSRRAQVAPSGVRSTVNYDQIPSPGRGWVVEFTQAASGESQGLWREYF